MGAVRRHPVLAALVLALIAVVGTLAVTGIAVWRAAHTDDARRLERADVILVLGAAQYGGDPSPTFRGRLDHALLLYTEDRADRIVVLGGGQPGDVSTEGEAGRAYLLEHGVPAEAVLASPHGSTTFESLRAASRVLRDRGWETAFLVSDPWHNLRVKRMASDMGIEGYASATWRSAAKTEEKRLEGYVRETLAYLFYRLFGR